MTITSTNHHRFQDIVRQIICLFISFLSVYNSIMFKAKWDRQIRVYLYLKKTIVRDVISKTVLKVKICEKYKISSMLLIFQIKIFENTSILWINATWMNMITLKMYFQASITNNKKMSSSKIIYV